MALTDNIVAYFKAEDLTEEVSSLTLTNNNSVTFTSGKIDNAFTLNGTSQYLSRTDSGSALDLIATDFTLNCWVKWGTVPSNNTIDSFVGKFDSAARQYLFSQFNNSGTQQLIAEIGDGGGGAGQTEVNWTPTAGI